MVTRLFPLIGFVAIFASFVRADTITMTSGREVECVILNETPDKFTIRRGYGVMDVPKEFVEKSTRTPSYVAVLATATKTPPPAPPPTTPTSGTTSDSVAGRMPIWSNVVDAIARTRWGADLRQIPATYIDNGEMKDVPYQSFACSGEYEVNVYGDPDQPACVEIGVYRGLLNDAQAKANCVNLMASLLPNEVDASIARVVSRQKDLVTRDGLTIEITPPDAPDAYGGWWISIYSDDRLAAAKASPAEIASITVPTPSATPPTPTKTTPTAMRPTAPAPTAVAAVTGDEPDYTWTANDMAAARSSSSRDTCWFWWSRLRSRLLSEEWHVRPLLHSPKMSLNPFRCTIVVALLASASLAHAWGVEGHQVVALIAYAHLTPQAKAATKQILGNGADIYDAEVAGWADVIRRSNPSIGPYHYIDCDIGETVIDLAGKGRKGMNVVDGLTDQTSILAGGKGREIRALKDQPETREQALRWVVHLAGDIHQPLHVADRNNDAGGNGVAVMFEDRKTPTKLHAVWDGDMLRAYVTAFYKAQGAKKSEGLTDYAESLDAKISKADAQAWATGTPLDWANESHAVGIGIYRDLPTGDPVAIDAAYVAKEQPIVEKQLERAGVRLAAVLNKALVK